MKFYWLGDSWVAGDELYNLVDPKTHQQYAFPQLVSDHFGAECVNLGKNGHSPDVLPYVFSQIVNDIDPENDKVFFFLSADNRTWMFDEDNKLKWLGWFPGFTPQDAHKHTDKYFKYFDSVSQRVYNYDRAISLLYLWCQHLGIKCNFANIFTTQILTHFNCIPEICWLLPKDQCISKFILPITDTDNGIILIDDNPKLTNEQWALQKTYLKRYVYPNHAHPNLAGHAKIAQDLITLLQ